MPKQEMVTKNSNGGLTMMQGIVLDMVASGKSGRQISEVIGVTPSEATKMAYELLDGEIITDPDQRRKLQVYRLEKMVDALWVRTMDGANKDDVKNLREVLSDLNVLLGLNKEADEQQITRMQQSQLFAYTHAIKSLIVAFKMVAPTIMTEEQWATFAADELEKAQEILERG